MDVSFRAPHMLRCDFLEVFLVREHAGLLEQLDGISSIAELGREIRDEVDEVLVDSARVHPELNAARDDVSELPAIECGEVDEVGRAAGTARSGLHRCLCYQTWSVHGRRHV